MKLLDRTKKALGAAYKSLTVSWSSGDWVNSDAPGNRNGYTTAQGKWQWIPGTRINWDRVTGDLYSCPAVQSNLNWIFRNFSQAFVQITNKNKDGEDTVIENHPLVHLLNRPNPEYDGNILFQSIILSLELNGNAYIQLEYTLGGKLAELWWVPHSWVNVVTEKDSKKLIDYYNVTYPGAQKPTKIMPSRIVHLRYGLNPYDPRMGMAPLSSASRDTNALQQAGNYRPTILKNFGVIGRLVTPKTADAVFDPDEMKKRFDDQSKGDQAGSTVACDVPVDVEHFGMSAQDMALDTLEDRPEANICALFGLPLHVVGLHGGRESKTYNNAKEAREAAWEEKLMPLGSLLCSQIGYRLLPEFGKDPEVETLGFNYSKVRPLQPDQDKLHARVREDFRVGMIDRKRALIETGRPYEDDRDEGVYFVNTRLGADPNVGPNPDGTSTTTEPAPQAPQATPKKNGIVLDHIRQIQSYEQDSSLALLPTITAVGPNGRDI